MRIPNNLANHPGLRGAFDNQFWTACKGHRCFLALVPPGKAFPQGPGNTKWVLSRAAVLNALNGLLPPFRAAPPSVVVTGLSPPLCRAASYFHGVFAAPSPSPLFGLLPRARPAYYSGVATVDTAEFFW